MPVMFIIKTQAGRPTLLGTLADPWLGPIQLALLVGVMSHWTLSWLVLSLTGWMWVAALLGVAHGRVEQRRIRAIEGILADGRYWLSAVAPGAIPCLASAEVKGLVGDAVEDPEHLLIFAAVGKTRQARLAFTTRCFIGDSAFPTLILVPEVPRSPQAEFEMLHELGHSNHHALNAELYASLDPLYAIIVPALAAILVAHTVWFWAWGALWLATRLFYWMTVRRTGIESEALADAFAYDVIQAHDPGLVTVEPFARAWQRSAGDRRHFGRCVQSRARLRSFNARRRGAKLPLGIVQYSPFGMLPTIALVLGALFCTDDVWHAVIMCMILNTILLCLGAGEIWLKRRACSRLKSALLSIRSKGDESSDSAGNHGQLLSRRDVGARIAGE